MRHVTAPLHTQHSAKEYVFRLEQSAVRPTSRPIVRPDLHVLRGNSQAAAEARATLSAEVRARLPTTEPDDRSYTFSLFRQVVDDAILKVCGPSRRSCRKPWLRTAPASNSMQPLMHECNDIRRRKRQVQMTIDELGDPDGDRQTYLDRLRAQHAAVKGQQQQFERDLERAYWNDVLAAHPTTAADSFQFFHTLKHIQTGGKTKAARMSPFAPAEWKDHFEFISSEEEFLTEERTAFIATLPVTDEVRQLSLQLDNPLSDQEIDAAVRGLRSGAGGGDGVPPVVLKVLCSDDKLAADIRLLSVCLGPHRPRIGNKRGWMAPGGKCLFGRTRSLFIV